MGAEEAGGRGADIYRRADMHGHKIHDTDGAVGGVGDERRASEPGEAKTGDARKRVRGRRSQAAPGE